MSEIKYQMKTNTCKDCGKEILFLELSESKSKIIVDINPIARWVKVPLGDYALLDTYTSHGETCTGKRPIGNFVPFVIRKGGK